MLTVTQAAKRLGITAERVRQLIKHDAARPGTGLRATRLGLPPRGVYMVEEADLEAFAALDRRPGKRRVEV